MNASGIAKVFLVLILAYWHSAAPAQEALKLAIGMHGNWEDAAPDLGQRAGIFQKNGMKLELLYTRGAADALQAVISGSVDIGVGVGTAGVMAAYAKGAPVRVIGSATTGTNDIYWYVRSDSPLKSLKDATPSTTITYSTTGAATHFFVMGLLKVFDSKAKPTATGDMQSTLTQVMTGQVDIGFAAPPMGLQQIDEGNIRIIARASDIPWTRDQTVRLIVVNANKLEKDRQLISRFIQAYSDTIDWMYSSPDVFPAYKEYSGTSEQLTRKVMTDFYVKDMLDPYRISGLDSVMDDALSFKFLQKPLTKEQLSELFQVPERSKQRAGTEQPH